jgi:hypothetical protein
MAEPESRLLRELREAITAVETKLERALDHKFDLLSNKIDRNHEELKQAIEIVRQGAFGESVLARYATAGFEQRISSIEHRVTALEEQS